MIVISCGSSPQPRPEPHLGAGEPAHESFITTLDGGTITEEFYISTRLEVQQFIQNLNQIIRSRNFNEWRAVLSPQLFAEISSEENLRQISEQPIMRNRRIVLRNAQDYFFHVVVPSRVNISDEVDDIDIEFITLTSVRAFTVTTTRAGEEQQVLLYALEKVDNSWTIIN